MNIIEKFRNLAREKNNTIILPEGEEERVIRAAAILKSKQLVKPVLLGDPDKIRGLARSSQSDISGINIIHPASSEYYQNGINTHFDNNVYFRRSHGRRQKSKSNSQTTYKNYNRAIRGPGAYRYIRTFYSGAKKGIIIVQDRSYSSTPSGHDSRI